jgi:hypothetical protein
MLRRVCRQHPLSYALPTLMNPCSLLCFLTLTVALLSARADILTGSYDMAAVRDASTLETRVVEDWKPMAKNASIRQKLVEITICEWWPGQKVRLPVTFNAPANGAVCKQIIIGNAALTLKSTAPTGAMLRLLKEQGVGVVLIGMSTIDAMQPAPMLMPGMKEHMLATKDARYSPAWIWGMSNMRAITAAFAEKDVFQPQQVLVTGGSKRGVATAAAGIHDDRVTAILPVVAPIIDSPGGPYVHGMMSEDIKKMNEQFIIDLRAGKISNAPVSAVEPLLSREKIRANERITQEAARAAGWSEAEMRAMCAGAWTVCRTTNHWPALKQRGLEVFYNQGSNDNVGPGLIELGERFPDFPIYIVPGGQHGGSKETGFTQQVGSMPEVDENLYAFAMHHFFKARRMVATPKILTRWDIATRKLYVTATFPDGSAPQKNDLWISPDRHPDYSMQMEYDAWTATALSTSLEAEIIITSGARTLDLITVHAHAENGSTLTVSSPVLRLSLE